MRKQVFVQEHHLLEAVRRQVITEGQMQELLSIAQSMAPAINTPNLSWLTVVLSVLVGGIAFVPAMMTLKYMHDGHEAETLLFSAVAVVGLLVVTKFMRRNGLGKAPTGIAAAGAAMWCWGLGAGIVGTLVFPNLFHDPLLHRDPGVEFNFWKHSIEAHHLLAYLAGEVAMLVGAITIGMIGKIPATASAGAVALLAAIMHVATLYVRSHGDFTDRDPTASLLVASVLITCIGFVMQRMTRTSRFDPAFWVLTVGVFSLGLSGCSMIEQRAVMVLPWLAAALAAIAVGVKLDRKLFIIAGCTGLLTFTPLGVSKVLGGDAGVIATLLATVAVAVILLIVRRVYVARAAQGHHEIEQSVWA
jgi:hypothetical protein